jgi:hypothetical protein
VISEDSWESGVFSAEYSEIAYDDGTFSRVSLEGVGYVCETGDNAGLAFQGGWTAHWGQSGTWGTGPRLGLGYCSFYPNPRLGFLGLISIYLWAGEEADDFAVGLDGDMRLSVILRL